MVAGRWAQRLLGLASTIVLARLLLPADFGLIAMAMLVIGALEVLAETGQQQAIIRMKEPTRAHYDTAWTVGLLIGLSVSMVLIVLAPLVAQYFADHRLVWIIRLLGLRAAIQACGNIGIVTFQRRLDFRSDVKIILLTKFGAFLVTMTFAYILQSYWALVVGTLAGSIISVLLSYAFSDYRPRASLRKVRAIWSFSTWALVTHIGVYAGERVDQAVLTVSSDASTVGAYTVGAELAALPTEELVVPPVRALYAVYARVADDRAALREHYLAALSFVAIVASATSVGVALVAADAAAVVLGQRWHAAIPLIPWLAIASGVLGVARSVNAVLLAAGYAWANAWRAIVFAVALLPCSILGMRWGGVEGVAIARFVVTLAFAPIMLLLVVRLLQVPPRALIGVLWRPVVAAAIMTGIVLAVHPYLPAVPLGRLAAEAACGAATYAGALGVLWLISGRPRGAEATIWAMIHARWERLGG